MQVKAPRVLTILRTLQRARDTTKSLHFRRRFSPFEKLLIIQTDGTGGVLFSLLERIDTH
jgi:hypothetical protein